MESNFKGFIERWAPVLRIVMLVMICLIAVLIRVFSVIRFESIIHEFDPWFNYRTTRYLAEKGVYEFWNWFDSNSWFPLGRVIGGTLYPGIMMTAGALHQWANLLTFPIDIRNVCVFLAPIFSALTALACYLLTKEVTGKTEPSLFSALFISIVPSYISRSVAGSYDYEGVAIFALLFTFYLWIKAANTGSLIWSGMASLSFFYMAASWGGYAFIVNIIPIFAIVLILIGRFNTNTYIGYCSFHILGTLLAMQIPFIGFQAVTASEHLPSHTVFIFINVYYFCEWIKEKVGETRFNTLKKVVLGVSATAIVLVALFLTLTGRMKWTGRSLSLLDPTYAKKFIPIVASVSEHQPTTWSSFFFDLHILVFLAPAGFYYCIMEHNNGKLFIALYGVLSVYFASVMVRLLLVLAPALCILAGIGLSETIHRFARHIIHFREWWDYYNTPEEIRGHKPKYGYPLELSIPILVILAISVIAYINHCVWVGAEAYSSPTIIMSHKGHDGEKIIVDDYREAYYWLRMNTKPDAKIMSWWDYGYQITGMGNRTVLVDNNTWNNTHIATVGMIFASDDDESARLLRKLDANYVLVLFGGLSYYSGDDINKFLWMIRIASGVFPHIKEDDFLNRGQYRVDGGATETMMKCLMYRLSYYRFGQVGGAYGKAPGYDVVRQTEIGLKDYELKNYREVYTTKHWIIRIFEILPEDNREVARSKTQYIKKSEDYLLQYNLTRSKTRPSK
ncbi:STT3A_3 [Blepharisma stoltei]|uniref:dolichyl-diphosphooligosaccharide--protein glycotransferase n=1 Tax=Blepharisma stoltei TaxID=1481888 RepID=A0AAU9JTF7_9CILI|nr:unnamed protein product [Blepharisma stoltei]